MPPQNNLKKLFLIIAVGITLGLFILFNACFAAQVFQVNKIESLFSPEDNCGAKILQVLEEAKESIDVAMYSFTNRVLAQGLVKAHLRGVRVRIFMDQESRQQKYSKADYLIRNGIEVKFKQGTGLMHNKFCIADGKTVLTGSFNWTVYADLHNDENLAIINSNQVAQAYKNKFEQLWQGKGYDEMIYINETRLEKKPLY